MKKEKLFYYRGNKKVFFEPRNNLLAVSLKADLSNKQGKEFLEYVTKLKLQPEKVGTRIQSANVRIFRYPTGTTEEDTEKIWNQLTKHPLVRRVGPILHLSDESVSFMTNEFVVKFKKQIGDDELNKIADRSNMEVTRKLPYAQNTYVLRTRKSVNYGSIDIINELEEVDYVEYAEPNLATTIKVDFTPNDYLFAGQPHHQIINTEDAWDITRGNEEIIIAVVDIGCDIDHPDFTNPSSAGWDKIYESFDFENMDSDPINTVNDHGTKSCGIVTANADNNEGIAGVAPGCRLMPIRLKNPSTDIEDADMYVWISGLDPESGNPDFPDPITPGADVISNSIGKHQAAIHSAMEDALDYITNLGRDGLGCVVVYSVGNDNVDFSVLHNPGTEQECGGQQWAAHDRTIAVASSTISPPDAAEIKAGSSNFGSLLDVCAPGGGSRASGETRTLSTGNVNNGDIFGSASATTADYSNFGQTSCACPQVAGIAALMLSVNPGLTWQEVRQIIRETAIVIDDENTDPVGQWEDTDGDGEVDFSQWYGYGRVDAYRAVSQAQSELPIEPFTVIDIATIVAAQEVIYMRRIVAFMKKFIDECPTPPQPPHDSVSIPIKLILDDINKLEELKALRGKYISSMHADQELLKAVTNICRENGDLAEKM